MLFRGYLPMMSGAAMAQFLNQEGIKFRDLKSCLLEHAATLKAHAQSIAEQAGRPFLYLAATGSRKEQRAREMAEARRYSSGPGVRVCPSGTVQDLFLPLPTGPPLRQLRQAQMLTSL